MDAGYGRHLLELVLTPSTYLQWDEFMGELGCFPLEGKPKTLIFVLALTASYGPEKSLIYFSVFPS
jgi:hypothetical protein